MESTPPSSKRMKSSGVKRSGRLEGWFVGKDEKIEKYIHETSRKAINNPKLITSNWLNEQKLSKVGSMLKEQQLKKFLEMSGNIYPDLVRVFYTNLPIVGDTINSRVKGVDLETTLEVLTTVPGLKFDGLRINKGNIGVVEEFNKMQFYRCCLKNLQTKVRNFSVGGLRLNERHIAFTVSWMLAPRGNNHPMLTKEDFVLIYCIMNKIKINWINIIKEHMQKSMRLSDYHYPYVVTYF